MDKKQLKRKDLIRQWIPYFLREFIRLLIVNRMTGEIIAKIFHNQIPHRDCRIETSSRRISPVDKAALFFKLYERSEIDQTIAYLERDFDVIELGGSIGANSTQILRKVDESIKVVIVESDPELCEILTKNVNNNSKHPDTFIVNAAIDYSGTKKVELRRARSTLRGQVLSRKPGKQDQNKFEVETITLREILRRFEIDVFILVSDIEGAEIGIFLKDQDILNSKCFRIIVELDEGEYDGRFYSIDDVIELADSNGLSIVHRHGNRMVFENRSLTFAAK
jgi:FkbM family methyltransferase